MSDRMTEIHLPGRRGAGIADYGRKPVAEMIAQLRARAELAKRDAEAILAAQDSDFHVCTYLGIHAQRDRVVLQEGMRPPLKGRRHDAPIDLTDPEEFGAEHA